MAGTIVASTLSDGTNSTSTTNCIQGSAKAWVNFQGTSTVTIRSSYNVSSITDNGTGYYTVNFTNALTDANYCAIASSSSMQNGTTGKFCNVVGNYNTSGISTTALNVYSGYTTGQFDEDYIMVAVFR